LLRCLPQNICPVSATPDPQIETLIGEQGTSRLGVLAPQSTLTGLGDERMMRGFCHCGEKTCNIALFLFALYLEIWREGFGRQCTVDLKQGMTSLVMHGMTGEGTTPSLLDVSIKQENILSLLQVSTTLAFLSIPKIHLPYS
jgi:hypothetical protein